MILTLFLIHTAVCTTVALNPSTQGHIFFTGFFGNLLNNRYTGQKFQLRVLTLREAPVAFNVSSSNGFNYTGNTKLNNPALVKIPDSFEVLNYTYEYRNLGLIVESSSSEPIFVLGIIEVYGETSATFQVHPYIEQPTKEYVYYGISFETDTWTGYVKQLLLVGCKDNTNITIKPSVDITVSANIQQPTSEIIRVHAGESYTFILDELQTLVLYSTSDTTGTKIISNKPLSVISGQFGFRSAITTQLPPTITWGKTFILPSLGKYINDMNEQHFKVIASEDTTRVDIQCNTDRLISVQFINEGEFFQFCTNHDEYCSVVTNKPCYLAGFYSIEVYIYDVPLIVTVPPLEQYAKDDVIIAPHTRETFYTVIISHDYNKDSFLIDTDKSSINWTTVNYSNGSIVGHGYSGYLDNTADISTFSASGKFLVIVFGLNAWFRESTGFGYTPNMEFNPINIPPVYIRFVSQVYHALEENEKAVVSIEKESSTFIGDVKVKVRTKKYTNTTAKAEGKLITIYIIYSTHYYPAATDGIDFKAINETIVLRHNQTMFNLTIVLIDDDILEIEYFTVEITPLDNNIIIDDRAAVIVISDSDGTFKSIVSLSQ